jgi:ABC-type polysaccharide transport system, permease component
MYGSIIAFKNFQIGLGISDSPWIGLENFMDFFQSTYCWRIVSNTFLLSVYDIIWGFPAPIILALLINEVKNAVFKRAIQTLTYLPYFISLVVICGIIIDFTSTNGIINQILSAFGMTRSNLLARKELFRTIFVSTNIWRDMGWGSIIYLAALTGIDLQLYEAATIDGAKKWAQMLHITIPGIAPTIIIMLILRLGSVMSVGFEKVILLYNPLTYETAGCYFKLCLQKGTFGIKLQL